MKFLKKKQFVLFGLVLVVCMSVFLNRQLGVNDTAISDVDILSNDIEYEADKVLGEAKLVNAEIDENAYFASARLTRTTSRDEALEILNDIICDENSSQDDKNSANQKKEQIAQQTISEGNIENMITAKGFASALVVCADDSVTVMVQSEGLLGKEVAQISEIVTRETGIGAKNITVVEIN